MTWRRALALYGIAHFGKSLLWTASDLLTLYLLVAVHSLDPILAGTIFLSGLAANAFADLAVGVWLNRHPRHAARLAGSALALAAATFPATVLLAPNGPWAVLAATLAFRIAYAGCDVPHNALLTRLGSDPRRAVWLARWRTVGTALASLLAAGGAGGMANVATAPLLWGIAGGAWVIGSAMVPLLGAYPLIPHGAAPVAPGKPWLPLPFLVASVIGIVALGALGKAVLHLPGEWHRPGDGTTILMLLIAGRTASALIPLRIGTPRRGLAILAAGYGVAAAVAAAFAWNAASGMPAMLVLLGMAMGATNLIGWALLPTLADGPRGYGLYTMASKLALGVAGLALAGGLGRVPTFTTAGFATFALMIAAACGIAAALLLRRLTPGRLRPFSRR